MDTHYIHSKTARMKIKLFLASVAIVASSLVVYSQDYSSLKDIVLKDTSDYPKAEGKVLECASYLLSTPLDDNNINRKYAIQLIIRWMTGTPAYTFGIDQSITQISKSNASILLLYMACMSKYALENKENSKDPKEMKYNSMLLLISYVEDSNHKVKIDGELKKLIQAKKQDKLKQYLKI